MKTIVTITVDISAQELERLAREQLGMERPKPCAQAPAPTLLGPALHPASEAVRFAIGHVIRATDKLDQARYSPGEAAAMTALLEAGKRLKKAAHEERKTKSQKGVFNV